MRRVPPLIVLLLALLALSFGAAACGGGDEAADTEAPAETEAPATEEEPAETEAPAETEETTEQPAEPAGEPLVVGFAIGQSGFVEPYDVPPASAAEIAIAELNASGGLLGRPIETVYADTKSDINEGANAGIKVLEAGAELMVVTCDFDFGSPAALEAQKAGVIAFSTCAASTKFGPTGVGDLAFTMATAAPAQAAIITEFAHNEKGFRNLYLLLDPTIDYEKQFCAAGKQRWEELGGTVVGEDTFQQGDESIASQITRLKGIDPQPDVILLCSYQPGASAALRQLRAAGIDAAVIGGEDQDGSYWLEAVPGLNDLYYATYGSIFGDDPDPKVNELVAAYTEQFGEPPATAHFLTGYSAIEAWAQAVEQAGTTEGAAVRDALQSFQDVPLLVGPTSYSPEWHIQLGRSMRIIEVQDGQPRFLKEARPESTPLPE